MRRYLIAGAIVLMLLAGLAVAQDLDGEAIVKKMTNRSESDTTISETKMIIVDADGNKRERKLLTRAKKIDGRGHIVTTFLAPPDVRGVKFLVIENPDGDDDQRIYLPALRRVRRITSSNKTDSFMGSTFSYADLQSYKSEDGTHTRKADMKLNGHDCFVVESIPKPETDTQYSKLIYWVRKDNFVPIRGEFYDKQGKLFKVLEVLKVEKLPDGTWLTKLTKMSDVQARRVTVLEIMTYKINEPIEDFYFTERFLKDESRE